MSKESTTTYNNLIRTAAEKLADRVFDAYMKGSETYWNAVDIDFVAHIISESTHVWLETTKNQLRDLCEHRLYLLKHREALKAEYVSRSHRGDKFGLSLHINVEYEEYIIHDLRNDAEVLRLPAGSNRHEVDARMVLDALNGRPPE